MVPTLLTPIPKSLQTSKARGVDAVASNLDVWWDYRPAAAYFREWATFTRLVVHDRRGTGLSDAPGAGADLETRVRVKICSQSWTTPGSSERRSTGSTTAGLWARCSPPRGRESDGAGQPFVTSEEVTMHSAANEKRRSKASVLSSTSRNTSEARATQTCWSEL